MGRKWVREERNRESTQYPAIRVGSREEGTNRC